MSYGRNSADLSQHTVWYVDQILKGASAVMDEAVWRASRRTVGFHVSMDTDFVDPYYAPGVGTLVPGGPTYRESHLAMEKIVFEKIAFIRVGRDQFVA